MPFAYDKIQLCVAFFHPKEPIPTIIQEAIEQVSTTLITNNGNKVDDVKKKRATDYVLAIRRIVYQYLHSHLSLESVELVAGLSAAEGEKLKDKGLAYSLKVAKFSRFVMSIIFIFILTLINLKDFGTFLELTNCNLILLLIFCLMLI
jgi:hypothetical protein